MGETGKECAATVRMTEKAPGFIFRGPSLAFYSRADKIALGVRLDDVRSSRNSLRASLVLLYLTDLFSITAWRFTVISPSFIEAKTGIERAMMGPVITAFRFSSA